MTSTSPQTRAEQSAFEETSRYADVRAFIDGLAQATPRVRVEMFGRSEEGRDSSAARRRRSAGGAPLHDLGSRLPSCS